MNKYPKRLIEVDLPIQRISKHARREKSIRQGHISTMHLWWARRPLAACRAVICATLWPDPGDELCHEEFRNSARNIMINWSKNNLHLVSNDSYPRFVAISKNSHICNDNDKLRNILLDFIADFSDWDNSNRQEYIDVANELTKAANKSLGGLQGHRPLVVDSFAGGGAIPIEALRVGADVFASDLNSIPVLLNKVILEYIPKFKNQLVLEFQKMGKLVRIQAENTLQEFYPTVSNNENLLAYLWARTICCEGPGCGAIVPLIRSLWLSKKAKRSFALELIPDHHNKIVDFKIIKNIRAKDVGEGTVRRGAVLCPLCGYTTHVNSVRRQLNERDGGTKDSVLLAVVTTASGRKGRIYRLPTKSEKEAPIKAIKHLKSLQTQRKLNSIQIPDEKINEQHHDVNRAPLYGMKIWGDLFTPRQAIANSTISTLVKKLCAEHYKNKSEIGKAVKTLLALAVDRQVDYNSSLVRWVPKGEFLGNTFSRQALSFVTDYAEVYPFSGATGDWNGAIGWIVKCLKANCCLKANSAQVDKFSATDHILPDASAQAFITDPPYYDSINYGMISDFFYVWLRRLLNDDFPELFKDKTTNKDDECVVNPIRDRNNEKYQKLMQVALSEGRRILEPSGIGVVVFAHKSTSGWETLLQAMINAGWVITASWPIDSEMAARLAARGQARLASSVHLVCRPRKYSEDSDSYSEIGDWRDVLIELPKKIHHWMPRLSKEGIVGADAIFSCLGPALEIFSRYTSVEKASGEKVELKEYLEQVWAAVAKEALNMIFEGADASGFEEDARLTAMWLWTLRTSVNNNEESENDATKTKSIAGYTIEFDAARKIAQGLGAHLENLEHLVETKGDKAILLSASSRARHLFGKDTGDDPKRIKKKQSKQMTFDFADDLMQIERDSTGVSGPLTGRPGGTVLDQLHQSMILFGAGRGVALRRFLIEDGIGRNPLYWRLAQALSALYPSGTDEKRWVDGVLARKKGLGF